MKYIIPFYLLVLFSCNTTPSEPSTQPKTDQNNSATSTNVPKELKLNVISVYPHDTSSFTEGLQIYDGKLYEGAGNFAHSGIEIADIKTGKILQKHIMGTPDIFGEGINVFKNKLYQLTWQSHVVYVYDLKDITKPIKTFPWLSEGWGMTNDGTNLIISDGGDKGYLYYVNPDNFSIVKTITVQDESGPVSRVNELEYIDGYIYANDFMTDTILKIDPATGNVVARINCAGILQQAAPKEFNDPSFDHNENVLNGIAYDSTTKKIYITGKRWPKLFEVTFN